MKQDKLERYLIDLQSKGRYSFNKTEACKAIGWSDAMYNNSAHRLSKRGLLAHVRAGFFINVIPEHRSLGALPPDWFIDELMIYLKREYYVGLLSAATYYGASHQQPQSFQIMTHTQTLPIDIGKLRLSFTTRKQWPSESALKTFKTYTGEIKVASPELIAVDLCDYPEQTGYIHNIAQVLQELLESIDRHQLDDFLELHQPKTATLQRLGYLFEYLERYDLAFVLGKHLDRRTKFNYVLLVPGEEQDADNERHKRWKLIVNEQIELDI